MKRLFYLLLLVPFLVGATFRPWGTASSGGSSPTPDILWWKFANVSGSTLTATVGPNGTLGSSTAAPTTTTGSNGSNGALQFDGVNDTLQSASAVTYGVDTITVCVWTWWTTFANTDNLLMESSANSNSNSYTFFVDPNSSSLNYYRATKLTASPALHYITRPSAGAWHHMAFVFAVSNNTNADATVWYMDGVLQSSTLAQASGGAGGSFSAQVLYVMCRGASSLYAAGKVADLRIYARALNGTEVTQVYNDPQ